MIDATGGVTTGAAQQQLFSNAAESTLGKDAFLQLLVAQLTHQDPMSPMENTEFVAQLAQFSNLEQMVGVNSNLELLQIAQASSANAQVAGLIGKEIEAKGDSINYGGHGEAKINFDLSDRAAEVKVTISDARGNVIRTIESASGMSAGLNSVVWDGRDARGNQMASGRFSVSVEAKDASGKTVSASSRFKGTVTGVSYSGGIPLLEVGDSTVQVSDVMAVRQPSVASLVATGVAAAPSGSGSNTSSNQNAGQN